MIKVIIVDDELLVRIGLKSSINWAELGYIVVGEAANGKEALKQIREKKPALLLLDIVMPEMDGITLLKQLRKEKIEIATIILSSHGEFDNVKTAMKFGAIDFILKLSFDIKEISDLLLSLKSLFPKSDDETNESQEENLSQVAEEILAKARLNEQDPCITDYPEINENFIMLIGSRDRGFSADDYLSITSLVIKEVTNFTCRFSITEYDNEHIFAIFYQFNDDLDYKNITDNLVNMIYNSLSLCIQQPISIGYSTLFPDLNQFNYQIKITDQAHDLRFFQSARCVFSSEDFKSNEKKTILLNKEKLNLLQDLLYKQKTEEIIVYIEDFTNELHKRTDVTVDQVRASAIEICNTIMLSLKEQIDDFSEITGKYEKMYEQIYQVETLNHLRKVMQMFITFYLAIKPSGNRSDYVQKIKNYVYEHYAEKLSLQTAAEIVHLNETYFSHLFKKETGENFISFINTVRINQAKKLLLNGYKINETAFLVGYDNVGYFSSIFKSITGVSPSKIKRNR